MSLPVISQLRPSVFLDRDGTIITDKHYLRDPALVEVLPGARAALLELLAAGYLLFMLTNQSGVARGLFTLSDVDACNHRMLELLALPAPGFTDICVAPEGPDDPVLYRKPSPRFLLEMRDRYRLDPTRSWMVGDKPADVQTGLNAGFRAALLGASTASLPSGVPCFRDLKGFASSLLAQQHSSA